MGGQTRFIGPGLVLFLDQLIVAAANWFYWLIISRIISPSELGQATVVISLVVLISTISQLGLEYPLLRKSSIHRHQILGTTLAIELIITIVSVPVIIFLLGDLYGGSLQRFAWISIGILILSSFSFVSRFALLGISNAKKVLIIDVMGLVAKFVIGFATVLVGLGTLGILLSVLLQGLLISTAALIITNKIFSFKLDNIRYIKEIIIDGLVNAPSKLSKTIILSLSVVLLASFGISNSQIGIFYVALMISVVIGGFATSMAYMAIPVSTVLRTDLSSASLRIGLNFTAPLISVLLVAPSFILSFIGPNYVSADGILFVLSISVLPTSITMNAISKFNTLEKHNKLIAIGSVEILTFIIAFYLLVPNYGTIGASFSILLAFISSSVLSIIWLERASIRYIGKSIIAIFVGSITGSAIRSIPGMPVFLVILTSVIVTMVIIILLKNTTTLEMRQMIRSMIKRR